jgi:hypothetical protein
MTKILSGIAAMLIATTAHASPTALTCAYIAKYPGSEALNHSSSGTGAVLDLDSKTFLPPNSDRVLSITSMTETAVAFQQTYPDGSVTLGQIDRVSGHFFIIDGKANFGGATRSVNGICVPAQKLF